MSQGIAAEAALAFAMAGDNAQAESLMQEVNKRSPAHEQMQSLWLPAIRVQLALNRKNPASALTALQALFRPSSSGELHSSPIFPACIRRMSVEKRISPLVRARKPLPSSRRSSTTAASCGTAGREPWRIWEWRVAMHCSRELHKARMLMLPASAHSPPRKISSRSGKTPTLTSPSSSLRKRNMRS
jgi:hypothetical protein